MEYHNIKRLFKVIDRSLFMTTGSLDYDRITDAIIALANTVSKTETDENVWYIGEYGMCSLDDLIIGAYWHYTEWHGGQWSKGYAALCALGQIFSPGMTMPEDENAAYIQLNTMAEEVNQ